MSISDKISFSKCELRFMKETIKLQKKQNWLMANKLLLNASLAFNLQMCGIVRKSWILTRTESDKARSSI